MDDRRPTLPRLKRCRGGQHGWRGGYRIATGIVGVVVATLVISRPAAVCGQDVESKSSSATGARVVGNASCLAVACHGRYAPVAVASAADFAITGAGPAWSRHDPHARAAETVRGPRYRQILERWAARVPDESGGRSRAARCAACHDPLETASRADDVAADRASRGIGCESCHGPAERWRDVHFQRDVPRIELRDLGMVDLKQPARRAAACAACHLGDADHDLDHDMYAAGHPPLRYEFASYHARLPKHWRGDAERRVNPHYDVQLWAAGQLASAAAALDLTAARTARTWPELAEYNCLSCHQRLRAADTPGTGRTLSDQAHRPAWGGWSFRLALPLAARLDPHSATLGESWRQVRAGMDRPLDTAEARSQLARQAVLVRDQLRVLGESFGRFATRPGLVADPSADSPIGPRAVLELMRAALDSPLDWEAACQITLALEAVARDAGPARDRAADDRRRAEVLTAVQADLRACRAALAYGERQVGGKTVQVEWPRLGLGPGAGTAAASATGDWPLLLDRLRRAIRQLDELQTLQ